MKIKIDDLLPICQDFSGNYKEEGIYRINLAGIKGSSTGNMGYEPFLLRYKSKKEAIEKQKAIFKALVNNMKF